MSKFNLGLKWDIVVRNQKGKITYHKSGISKSLLRNFMYWLQSKFTITAITGYAASWTAPDTGNVARTFPRAVQLDEGIHGYFGALVNISACGLRVGRGAGAVLPTDYEMNNLISHGVGANQMTYGAQGYEAVTVVGQATSFRITRAFTNSSGVTITVTEIGAVLTQVDSANSTRYLCYLRDLLASGVPVPDGSTFTLRYTFSVTA